MVRAFEQQVSWLGHEGGGRAIAPLLRTLLPCGSEGGALWVRQQPLALPLSFPQFFSKAVGTHGGVHGAPSDAVGRTFEPELPIAPKSTMRTDKSEVMSVAVGAALQSSPALMPVITRVCSDWAAERKTAERAGSAEGWAQRDELAELTEQMAAIREAYGEGEVDYE